MLNKSNNDSFAAAISALTIPELREKESGLIDRILHHYDELEDANVYANETAIIESNIRKDLFKLKAVRVQIDCLFKTSLLNTTETIFQNLFADNDETPKQLTVECANDYHLSCMAVNCNCSCH
jgi:hypothetical protein